MRSSRWMALFVCVLFIGGAWPAWAADVAKIGMINFQEIMEKSKAGKYAQEDINRQGKQYKTELESKDAEIRDLKDKLDREAMVLSKEKRDEKEREFRIKVGDFKDLQKKVNHDMEILQKRHISRMQKEVYDIVQKIGKKEGYLMIMNNLGVLYTASHVDITDQVLKIYDQRFKPPQSK